MISLDLPGSDLKQISGVISWQSCGKPFENARRINIMHKCVTFWSGILCSGNRRCKSWTFLITDSSCILRSKDDMMPNPFENRISGLRGCVGRTQLTIKLWFAFSVKFPQVSEFLTELAKKEHFRSRGIKFFYKLVFSGQFLLHLAHNIS